MAWSTVPEESCRAGNLKSITNLINRMSLLAKLFDVYSKGFEVLRHNTTVLEFGIGVTVFSVNFEL